MSHWMTFSGNFLPNCQDWMTFCENFFASMIWDLNSVIFRPNKLRDLCKADRRLQTRHKWASFHIYKFRLILFQWFLLFSFWFYKRILAPIHNPWFYWILSHHCLVTCSKLLLFYKQSHILSCVCETIYSFVCWLVNGLAWTQISCLSDALFESKQHEICLLNCW